MFIPSVFVPAMKEEFEWAKENGMHISKFEVHKPLKEVLPKLAGRPVYVTIDIDVLDPAHAPGTGTVDAAELHQESCLHRSMKLPAPM